MSAPVLTDRDVERFWSKVIKGDGCWIWAGARNNWGRGVFGVNQSGRSAARIALLLATGEWHPKLDAMHSCHGGENGCVRPDHLSWGSHRRNCIDTVLADRCGMAKLTVENVQEIRSAHAAGERQADIASRYRVSASAVSRIVNRIYWTEVDQ